MKDRIEIELRVQMKRGEGWVTLDEEVARRFVMAVETEPIAALEAVERWYKVQTWPGLDMVENVWPLVKKALDNAREVLVEPLSNYPVPLKAEGLEETELPGL